MKNEYQIDWDAVAADTEADSANLERLRRVVDLFDRFHLAKAAQPLDAFRWGPLEAFSVLGSGSFGTVYRAYDGHLRREVALKLLSADAPGAAGWLQEARRLARVRHPNVVAILGAEVHDGRAGIWMEFSDGTPLESTLANDHTLPVSQVLELARSLASALDAIHGQDLVHGDLKAGNVLVEPSGRVLLLDFGAATEASAMGPARAASPLSSAPEVLAGELLCPASDQFALGVLLYRCLSGAYPFVGKDVAKLQEAHAEPPDFSNLPAGFRGLLRALLERDPANRPDAQRVLSWLAEIEALPARRRRRFAVGVVVTSLAVGLLAAVIGWWQTEAARDAAERSAQQSRASLQLFQDVVGATFQGTHGKDARVIEVLEQARRQLALDESQPSFVRAKVQYIIGSSYLLLGRAEEGMALLDDSLERLSQDDQQDSEAIALVLVQQGLEKCGADAEYGEKIADQIRHTASGVLPADHQVFAAALKIEGCAASRRGNDDVALEKLEAAAALRPLSRFPADVHALSTAGRFGSELVAQYRAAEAMPILQEVRSGSLALLGPVHPVSLSSATALSDAFVQSSRFDEAVVLLDQTLPEIEARYGTGTYEWMSTASSLSTALARAGEPERALAIVDRLLEATSETFGATDSTTLSIRNNRGVRLLQLGRLEEAEQFMADTAAAAEAAVGADHPLALLSHINRIEVLVLLHRSEEAVSAGRRALATSLEALGPDHGLTAGAQAYLARALAAVNKFGEAETLFVRALAHGDQNSPESTQTLETRYYYATMLADSGRIDEARAELAALQTAHDVLPEAHQMRLNLSELAQRLR